MKRYVITEVDSKLAVAFPSKVEENNDGTFRDVDEDVIYYKGGYTYYPEVEIPQDGLWRFRYTYDTEEGFKLAYTQADVMAWQKQALEDVQASHKEAVEMRNLNNDFKAEKSRMEENLASLQSGALTDAERIAVLQETVCELYEMIIGG